MHDHAQKTRRRRRLGAVSAAMVAVLAVVIGVLAVLSPGLTSSDVEATDGGVWITNDADNLIGRINVDAEEIDGKLRVESKDADILQSGYSVFATGERGLNRVNTSSLSLAETIGLPEGHQAAIGGDRVAISTADGRLWILTPDQAAAFRPTDVEPVHASGGGALQVAVSTAGTVVVLDGTDILRFPRAENTADPVQEDPISYPGLGQDASQVQLTLVGEEPVILDRSTNQLRSGTDDHVTNLPEHGIDAARAQLQWPGAGADHVLLGTPDALVRIGLTSRAPVETLPSGATGEAIRPAQAGGCSYAAWNRPARFLTLCDGQEEQSGPLDGAASSGDLVFRVNGDLVVLNDTFDGKAWMASDAMQLVDQWEITQDLEQAKEELEDNPSISTTETTDFTDREEENRPPNAEDDEFGVRPGQSAVLPVVRNDSDPDGDLLTVSVEDGEQPGIGTVTPINGGVELQIDVAEDAAGTDTFTYVADDGRGGQDTATVTLTVHGDEENDGPRGAEGSETLTATIRQGQEFSFNVLPYMIDPDGDAFYLADATTPGDDDVVTFTPDGMITFKDSGLTTGEKTVELTLRDARGGAGEATLELDVVADRDLPPVTLADHVHVVAGTTALVRPLANDLNPGGGELELTHVDQIDGLDVEADPSTGTVQISGDEPGTHYLVYSAAAGAAVADGLIRVDVVTPTPESSTPVAVDDLAVVTPGTSTLVDPLDNDVDPTGGVLVTSGIDVSEDAPVSATVLEHHLVRIDADAAAEVGGDPVEIPYEVGNGEGTTTGMLRVLIVDRETQLANPIAVPEDGVVRAGDVVTVPVLDNDSSPTGSPLELGDVSLVDGAEDDGILERYGDQVRFTAAPGASGEIRYSYEAIDDSGRTGSTTSTLRIIPTDTPNSEPRPEDLEARTVSGRTIRIPVPTSGIDPDGDSVQLMGVSGSGPSQGSVGKDSGGWIEYTPHTGSTGTDRFTYQVMDARGAIGTGEVIVGIAPAPRSNQPPVAVDDELTVRPERQVDIRPLENDSDPEGAPLSIDRDEVHSDTLPIEDTPNPQVILTRTPEEPGEHVVVYGASDGQLTSTANILVTVDPEAPLLAPLAVDDFVEPRQILQAQDDAVIIDPVENDIDPDGSTEELTVSLDDAADGVRVLDDGQVRIPVTEEPQRLRYTVTDPDDLSASAYIWVPGSATVPPAWIGDTIVIEDGRAAEIDLDDRRLVSVRPGAADVRITDPATVRAEHADGTEIYQDESTLRYVPAEGYTGQDTISVQVTDGDGPEDPTAATGTLLIPVDVRSSENTPPTFAGASVNVAQGEPATAISLSASAEDADDDPLTFALGEVSLPEGVEARVEGTNLVVAADASAERGGPIDVPVTVTDERSDPVEATFQLTVTGSNRPLASAVTDRIEIDAGTTETIAPLENDANPFPDTPLELVDVQGSEEVAARVEGDQVALTPDADFHGVVRLPYRVQDATGDPDRIASGEIVVTVLGRPDPPSVPRIGQISDGRVELIFSAGNDNGAPIEQYTVTSASGPAVTETCASTTCQISGLENDTEYSFQVTATNRVGESDPSRASATARPDVRPEQPAPPQVTRRDGALGVSWSAPVNRGSAIQHYVLMMQDTETGQSESREVSGTSLEWTGLQNGRNYRFRVQAVNLAEDPSDFSGFSAPEHPAGPPQAPAGTPTASRIDDPAGGGIEVTFPAFSAAEANGEPITEYQVRASSGQTLTTGPGDRRVVFRDLDRNSGTTFTVTGVNSVGTGDASGASNEVTAYSIPRAPGGVRASIDESDPSGKATVSWDAADSRGTALETYTVRWQGGSREVSADRTSVTIDGLSNGTSYSFTVQASNGYSGGNSDLSSGSNAVIPYTTPDRPRSVSGSAEDCTDQDCDFRVTFQVDASGVSGNDGQGVSSIEYRIDGGAWQSQALSNGRASIAQSGREGHTYTLEARTVNSKGLKSDPVTGRVTADTAPPPPPPRDPRLGSGSAFDGATNNASSEPGCTSQNCTYFNVVFTDLEPGARYSYEFRREGSSWPPSAPISFTAPASGTYNLRRDGGHNYYYGFSTPVEVYLQPDGGSMRQVGSIPSPH
ncbi:MAG: Ig-like domain-containing protein [Brachybacterium sp.]|nr:Ig-like domain-containing protein [Brachybacterium sp.]